MTDPSTPSPDPGAAVDRRGLSAGPPEGLAAPVTRRTVTCLQCHKTITVAKSGKVRNHTRDGRTCPGSTTYVH